MRRPLRRPGWWLALSVLVALHAFALGAGILAPYDFAEQHRTLPFAPPTRLHFVDAEGRLGRPFVYPWSEIPDRLGGYSEARDRPMVVRCMVRTEDPRTQRSRWRILAVDPPAQLFLLGTDRYGRDVFSRLLYGARTSLFAGLLGAAMAVGLGWLVGAVSGFFGGWLDDLLMRISELFLALPWLYLLLAARAFLPLDLSPSGTFYLLVTLLGAVGWARPARLVRGVALSIREREFVQAARGFGASDLYLVRRHVLPGTLGLALTQLALLVPQYIVAEVTLSFLGLGVAEPVPSWGNMLAELREIHILTGYIWMSSPAVALIVVVLSYHALASALQDRLGPAAV